MIKYGPIVFANDTMSFKNPWFKIFENIQPFNLSYFNYFMRHVIIEYVCVRLYSLKAIGTRPKPGLYIFNYLELFYFDDYCMPYFDDYLCAKESHLEDVSERIMKLAIYCDYSTRFKKLILKS